MARDDRRLYAQFTLDYADSHKIAPLSDGAFRAHVRMILWSRRMLTDGRIPEPMAKYFAKPRALVELTTNDPVSPSLKKVGDDYLIHDFDKHQRTKEQIEESSRVNTANGRRGGRPKANRNATDSVSESQAKPNLNETQSTETETETTTSNEVVKTSSSEVADAPIRPEVASLLDLLDSEIEANGGKRPTRTKKNIDAMRLLIDRDGCTAGQVAAAIKWCQRDEFWRANILSASKLRDKYEQLRLAAQRTKSTSQPITKADQNAAEYQRLYGGGDERARSIPAIDAGLSA